MRAASNAARGSLDLAANASFEEVVYLLWFGKLPAKDELAAFETRLRGAMAAFPVGDALIGRLVDPFGNPLDGHEADVVPVARVLRTGIAKADEQLHGRCGNGE